MKKNRIFFIYILLGLANVIAQGTEGKPLKIFFDAYGSLFRYVQSDLNFADIVRNPSLAEIYIMMNSVRTGSGGSEYTLTFIGQNGFTGIDLTLKHTFIQNTSNEERNHQIIKLLKIGLARYIAETPYMKYLDVSFQNNFEKHVEVDDEWDGWVFGVGVNGAFRAEESKKQFNWELDSDIDRVSEASKFSVDLNVSNDLEKYNSDEGETTVLRKQQTFKSMYVLSISDHLSAGIFTGYSNSTYNNIKAAYNFSPAFEYNIFPYKESVRRNFTFLYKIGYVYQDYYNETIYFKNSENLFQQSLSIGYSINETWGDARFYLTAANFLHDFTKAKIELWSRFSYRLSGSLSLAFQLETSYLNDQLYLEQSGATLEEILFNQKSLATAYQYRISLGFRYTFGSIYNNIVNTRF